MVEFSRRQGILDIQTTLASIQATLDSMRENLGQILVTQQKEAAVSATTADSIANLTAAVAAETTVDNAVLTLLTTMAGEISAASPTGDNPAIDALVTTMTANAASLSAAVTANTPAAAPPPAA